MWCSTCQQDVPAIASPEDHRVRCAKCRRQITLSGRGEESVPDVDNHKPAVTASNARSKEAAASPPDIFSEAPFDLDDWDWDELREARRAVRSWSSKLTDPPANSVAIRQDLPAVRISNSDTNAKLKKHTPKTPRTRRFAVIAWGVLSLGVMACVFGGALLLWSFVTDRSELWSLGLPFAVGGQTAMVFGLILQLDGLWQSNDEAVESLSELDEQLIELRRATSQINAAQSSPGQSFYFHLSEGCSPQMLLADLKGQLDLLATRIADERRAA